MTAQAASGTAPDRPVSTWTGWGQWLALATMTVDHLTRYVFPSAWELGWAGSSIGRIAFPLFAAMVAWHGLFNTRNPLRYARRILIIGIAAQLPYMMMPRASDAFILNVCFTLALGLAWGAWLRQLLARHRSGSLGSAWLGAAVAATLAIWYLLGGWVEYGHRGLLLVPLFMLAMHHLHAAGESLGERLLAVSLAAPVLIVAGLMNSSDMAKSFTVATCLAVLWLAAGAHRTTPGVPLAMPRRLWLTWYPGHFALIALWLWASGALG
ncbi:TraX [Halomonas daqingensis]|uniref:TraX family protein n=1 Tax=Billgrantia desiderata TaxID=52021 RepID=UPI000A381EB9|nr:TraX family protein [Halomonas desiderata]MCE8029004.1 TraX [Halomonas desiderata]OUE46412.1 TraX [Halomonas desiderata SP1]